MIPLSFIALMTARVVNPYRALFETDQWLEQITNFLRRYVKQYVGTKKFIELVAGAQALEESNEILDYNSPDAGMNVRKYIEDKWGVKINHFNLVNFKPAGQRGKAYEEAAAEVYVATQHARATKVIAGGDAGRVRILAKAFEAGGEAAVVSRTIEALERTHPVIVGNQPVNILIDAARGGNTTMGAKQEGKGGEKK